MKLTAVALLLNSLAVQAGPVVHLVPAGEFAGRDGRPGKGLTWKLPDDKGRAIAARMNARHAKVQFHLDYEHQSMLSEKNGQPAPAAAWASKFEWRDGQGLFATDVEWTARAKQMIEDKEYKYLSPVILYNKQTGEVTGVHNAALVNDPALEELSPVAHERLARLNVDFSTQEEPMNKVLAALLKALGLPQDDTVTEAQATGALASLQTARSDLTALLKSLGVAETTDAATATTAIVTLKAKADKAGTSSGEPDPAKWVSLDKFTALSTEVAQLRASGVNREVDELITQATADGKCAGVVADVWRDIGKADITKLKSLIEKTPGNPALAGLRQSDNKQLVTEVAQLSDEQRQVCKNLGLDPKAYVATLKAQAEAAAV